MKDGRKFDFHLIYFTAKSYILWTFGIFLHFGMLNQEQSGNTEQRPRQQTVLGLSSV
jgi:hypothetical protein